MSSAESSAVGPHSSSLATFEATVAHAVVPIPATRSAPRLAHLRPRSLMLPPNTGFKGEGGLGLGEGEGVTC